MKTEVFSPEKILHLNTEDIDCIQVGISTFIVTKAMNDHDNKAEDDFL